MKLVNQQLPVVTGHCNASFGSTIDVKLITLQLTFLFDDKYIRIIAIHFYRMITYEKIHSRVDEHLPCSYGKGQK